MLQSNEFCKTIVFHFNKGSLTDPTIPCWTLKFDGKTEYVHHVDANASWSTKETPDNESTKGSLKFKNCTLSIDSDLIATITKMEQN